MPTAQTIRKYADWRGWLVGLYLATLPVSIGKVLDWFTSNSVEASGLDFAKGVGMSWKQILVTFGVSLIWNAGNYVKTKPLPDEIERPITPPPFAPK